MDLIVGRELDHGHGLVNLRVYDAQLILRYIYPHTPTFDALLDTDGRTLPVWPHLKRTADTGLPTLSRPIALLTGARGVAIHVPLPGQGRPGGYLGITIDTEELLREVMGPAPHAGFHLDLLDGAEPLLKTRPAAGDARFAERHTFRVVDREWTLVAVADPAYAAGLRNPVMPVFLPFGLLLALSAAFLYRLTLRGRVRAEESERRFRDLVEGSLQGVLIVQGARIAFANPAALRLFGLERADPVRGSAAFEAFLAPHERERSRALFAAIAARESLPDALEADCLRADGTPISVLFGLRLIRWNGRNALQLVAIDITARKRQEVELRSQRQLLQTVFDTSPALLVVQDRLGRYLQANESFTRVLGYLPEELVGHFPWEFLIADPADRDEIGGRFALTATLPCEEANRRFSSPRIRPFRAKTGEVRQIEWQVRHHPGSGGEVELVVACGIDITERTKAEQDLSESRSLLKTIMDTIPDWLYLKDRDGRFRLVNRAFAEFFQVPPNWFIGRPATDQVSQSETYFATVQETDDAILRRGQSSVTAELLAMDAEGRGRWLHMTKLPWRDAQGNILGVVGINRDITERKQIEERLRASEHLLRTIVDTLPMSVSVKDREGRYQLVNAHIARSYNLAPAALVGKTLADIAPDDSGRIQRIGDFDRKVIETGEVARIDEIEVRRGGQTYVERVIKLPLRDDAGAVTGVLTVGEDITERKKQEDQLTLLAVAVEHAGDGIMITDGNGLIEYINPALERDMGFTLPEALARKPSLFKSGAQDNAFYADMWNTILAGKKWTGRYTNRGKDGELHNVHSTITPIFGAAGTIAHFVSVYKDVTQLTRMEELLQRGRRMEAVGALAGGIAHDFNNLLTPVLGYARLLEREIPPQGQLQDLLRPIIDAALRAKDLVQRILLFSRRKDTPRAVVDPLPILQEVVLLLRSSIPATVEIRLAPARDVGAIDASTTLIHEALMNLCINAAQAMPDGGVLTLGIENVELRDYRCYFGKLISGSFVKLTVSDTGTGMTEDVMAHLFEPFFTTKEIGKGTGLGLASVFGVLQEHDGAIDVQSRPGQGSTFSIYLPRVAQSVLPAAPALSPPRGGTESVVCVDDDPEIAALFKTILEDAGYRVQVFTSPAAAAAAVRAAPAKVDLVITDLAMPGIRGDRLAGMIHEIRPDLPVLLCSGNGERLTAAGGDPPGLTDVLAKPVELDTLLRSVRRILDGKVAAASP
jgi:PAS domain S-box-containing protein